MVLFPYVGCFQSKLERWREEDMREPPMMGASAGHCCLHARVEF